MKPGTMVAFIFNAEIQFGILSSVIRCETKDGETTQYLVATVSDNPNRDAPSTREVTIKDEDDLVDASGWNFETHLHALARRLPSHDWAKKKSQEEEVATAMPVAVPVRPLSRVAPDEKPF